MYRSDRVNLEFHLPHATPLHAKLCHMGYVWPCQNTLFVMCWSSTYLEPCLTNPPHAWCQKEVTSGFLAYTPANTFSSQLFSVLVRLLWKGYTNDFDIFKPSRMWTKCHGKWLSLLLHIWQVPGSSTNPKRGQHDSGLLLFFNGSI
jgi:hypothetical protein